LKEGSHTNGRPFEVLPELYCIPVPLHGSPLRSINSWVIPASPRNLIIDTGMFRPECEEALLTGLDSLGVDPATSDVFITHLHADHSGLMAVLHERGAHIMMGAVDLELLIAFEDRPRFIEIMFTLGRSFGLDEEEIRDVGRHHPGIRYSPHKVPPVEAIGEGKEMRYGPYAFEILAVPGHTPGQLCLWEPEQKILVSGDHILGDITPNITCWPGIEDSLGDYLESLERTRTLHAALVLPGHRSIIRNSDRRIAELLTHHEERLAEIESILEESSPLDVCGVASRMKWDIVARNWESFPVTQKWFACGEASSHLDHLVLMGRAEREGTLFTFT